LLLAAEKSDRRRGWTQSLSALDVVIGEKKAQVDRLNSISDGDEDNRRKTVSARWLFSGAKDRHNSS
jgi:hypothetical protein